MDQFKHLKDEDLILAYIQGHDDAFISLIERYRNYARKILKNYLQAESIQFFQTINFDYVFYLSLYSAIYSFRFNVIPFLNYFKTLYLRDIALAIKEHLKDENNRALSLDNNVDDNGLTYLDFIEDYNAKKEINKHIDFEETVSILSSSGVNRIRRDKYLLYRKIIILKYQGYTIREIAENLKLQPGVIKRIIKKIQETSLLSSESLIIK